MKKRIIFVFMLFAACVTYQVQAQTATIQLTYKGSEPPEKLYLSFYDTVNDRSTRDSIQLERGQATYRLPAADVVKVTLYDQTGIRNWDKQAVFYVREGTTQVTIQHALPDIVVQNSPINEQYQTYKHFTATEAEAFERLNKAFGRAYQNKTLLDSIRPHRQSAIVALDSINTVFIRQHPASWFSLQTINSQISNYLTDGMYSTQQREIVEQLNQSFDALADALKVSPFGKKVADRLRGAGAALVGNPVIDFALPDKDGDLVDTKQMRGQVYLIDFWGSWCPWCRKGHPHMKELYERYHAKGFEIIAIGVEFGEKDTHREKWLQAIEEDQIPWKHVLNDNDVINLPQMYGVQAYPTKILVDRNGQIILRVTDDTEQKLDAKLAELLD